MIVLLMFSVTNVLQVGRADKRSACVQGKGPTSGPHAQLESGDDCRDGITSSDNAKRKINAV